MRFQTEKKHIIDLLFPIALFFVFAVSAVAVIILSANIYRSTTASSEDNYETGTVLSYVTEKLHQSDGGAQVTLGSFEGLDSLVIRQTYGGQDYVTYIYEDDGILRELFLQDGVDASASDGSEIMPVRDFSMKELSDGLFEFSCQSSEGKTLNTVAAVKSE